MLISHLCFCTFGEKGFICRNWSNFRRCLINIHMVWTIPEGIHAFIQSLTLTDTQSLSNWMFVTILLLLWSQLFLMIESLKYTRCKDSTKPMPFISASFEGAEGGSAPSVLELYSVINKWRVTGNQREPTQLSQWSSSVQPQFYSGMLRTLLSGKYGSSWTLRYE